MFIFIIKDFSFLSPLNVVNIMSYLLYFNVDSNDSNIFIFCIFIFVFCMVTGIELVVLVCSLNYNVVQINNYSGVASWYWVQSQA